MIVVLLFGASVVDAQTEVAQQDAKWQPDQASLPTKAPENAMILFDGKTNRFRSMQGKPMQWKVDDGLLVSTPSGKNTNHLVSEVHFRDADIHVEFMLPDDTSGNSGLYIHGHYEMQIFQMPKKDAKPDASQVGGIYRFSPPLAAAGREKGEWQVYDVRYRAPRRNKQHKIIEQGSITAWLNGQKVQDHFRFDEPRSPYHPFRYGTTDYLKQIAEQQKQTSIGPLFLQDHNSPVKFRNIWIVPLDDQASEYDAAKHVDNQKQKAEPQPRDDEKVDFVHQIFPVLKARCAKCHANGNYKGDLSLETRQAAIDFGVIEPGAGEGSELYQRIVSDDLDQRMPPEGHQPLTKKESATFKKWIDEGAAWPEELTLKVSSFQRPLQIRKIDFAGEPGAEAHPVHPVDRLVARYWSNQGIAPPKLLSANEFRRRLTLDVLGLLPRPRDETEFDVRDQQAVDAMVEQVLARNNDYANHWLTFWNDLLRNDFVGTGYIDGGRTQITAWLYQSLLENKPYDQFVRELIAPKPESAGFIKGIKWRGNVNASQVRELQFSQNVSQVFLGINMKCASCHDSFVDDWKLKDAYGLAAIVSDRPLEINRCDKPTGQMATAKFVFPTLGNINPELPKDQRLSQLASLMTKQENGRLARTIVNRIWDRLIGRGLVHPVDVMANEAWSEDLLDYLAQYLIDHQYDLKAVVGHIATSRLYRSASIPVSEKQSPSDYVFRGVQPKRMTAEQFFDAIWATTGTAPKKSEMPTRPQLNGKWIWSAAGASTQAPAGQQIELRKSFSLDQVPVVAVAAISCDNEFQLLVNGQSLQSGNDWTRVKPVDLRPALRVGENEILLIAKNAGQSPNPAAAYLEAILKLEDKSIRRMVTNETWQSRPADRDEAWLPAQPVANQRFLGDEIRRKLASVLRSVDGKDRRMVRAANIRSNPLMRSLGRPNREQVVTTRPAQLSTLQALDMSNGELMSELVARGSVNLNRRYDLKSAVGRDKLFGDLWWQTLGRKPTEKERTLLFSFFEDVEAQLAVEDLLWTLFMHPEFQTIR